MGLAHQIIAAPKAAANSSKAKEKPVNVVPTADPTDVATVEQQIEQHAQNIERIQGSAIVEIGRELKQAQELFRFRRDEGGFTGWLAARLPQINQRAAYRAIQRYEGLEEFDEFVKLSGSAQVEAVSAEPDVKAIIAERVAAGEVFTAAQVKELKEAAAREAVERLNADIAQARADLAALRLELAAKDQKSAAEIKDLQDRAAAQAAKLKGFEDQAAEAQRKAPKPAKAKEQAAETGGVVLGSDGKFHSGSSAEQKKMHDAFMFAFDRLLDLTEDPPSASRVAAGCPADEREKLAARCDAAITYLAGIKDAIDGK